MIQFVKLSDDAFLFPSLFSPREVLDITEELLLPYNSLQFKSEATAKLNDPRWLALSKTGVGMGDNLKLLSYVPKIKIAIQKAIKPPFRVDFTRCNTNIQFKYQDSSFHNDGYEYDDTNDNRQWSWTFLLFANDDWNTQWGGEFCYQGMDGQYRYVPYIPGQSVLFNGWLEHKGNAPNTMADRVRASVAWTFCTDDPGVSWRYPNI